jgi:hypothetical protein
MIIQSISWHRFHILKAWRKKYVKFLLAGQFVIFRIHLGFYKLLLNTDFNRPIVFLQGLPLKWFNR